MSEEYNKNADQAEKQLKFISPTMCYAKWAQVSLHLTNGMTHSCYHPPVHKINLDELHGNPSALHNTLEKKIERQMMIKGERPSGCQYCWRIEDAGGRSDRIYRSGEEWAQRSRGDIIDALDTGNIDPRYVEVNFNQACNFKCMYCSPHLSTTWEDEIKKYGPYNILDKQGYDSRHNDVDALRKQGLMPLKVRQEDNPYVKSFWQWWPQLYKKLEVFRMTGGEPLMDINTYKVLDYIYDHPNAWLEVSVTSNLCPPRPEMFDKFLEKLVKLEEIQVWRDDERWNPGSGNHWYVNAATKHFTVFVSLDSVGSQAKYIRTGLSFAHMDQNVRKLLNNTYNTNLTFINTFNALSVPGFKNFLQYMLDLRRQFSKEAQGTKFLPIRDPNYTHPDREIPPRQKIHFDIPLLRDPAWQSIHILPEEFETYFIEAIEFMKANPETGDFTGFYDFEVAKAERNLAVFRDRSLMSTEQVKVQRRNFVNFFKEYDRRRGLSFAGTFPEFKHLLAAWAA